MIALCGLLVVSAAVDAGTPLIPRAALLSEPAFFHPRLSPDGTKLAFLRPDAKGRPQLVVRAGTDELALTEEANAGLRTFRWTEDSTALLFPRDENGDEQFHLVALDVATKALRDLTPWPNSRNELLETSPKQPDAVLITSNRRDPLASDVVRLNWKTGQSALDTKNPGDVTDWFADVDLKVRAAKAGLANGGTELRVRDTVKSPWRPLITASLEESVQPFGFTFDGKSLLLASTISSDTERVLEKSLKTGTERLLASNPKSDVTDVTWNHFGSSLRAVGFEVAGRREWTSLDWLYGIESERLKAVAAGDWELLSTDKTDQKWVVAFTSEARPPIYFLWDRKAQQATPIGAHLPALDRAPLAAVTPVTIPTRDGLTLQGFLTLPPGTTSGTRLPMVLLVHGGPWMKDRLGFHPHAQLFANRGAAVLQVNYRGSTGYGKRFSNAGNRQWGLAMQDDLSDAVAWAVKEGVADGSRVAIMGTSYGGYATLVGLSKTPELYRCGVELAGPTNLFTLLASVPPWWKAEEARFFRRVGDPNDPKDKDLLTAASPIFGVERITAPLLIGQGQRDPRVKPSEPEQVVSALQAKGNVSYALYADEGHGLSKLDDRIDFAARAERLFASCLGTRVER